MVDEALLGKDDYVGRVSGSTTDKSGIFPYSMGALARR